MQVRPAGPADVAAVDDLVQRAYARDVARIGVERVFFAKALAP